MKLAGKVAIVTGSRTGIGRAIAERFASDGASVVLADVDDPKETADALVGAGGQAMAVRTDVADEANVQAMVDRTLDAYGRIDILVNNADACIAARWLAGRHRRRRRVSGERRRRIHLGPDPRRRRRVGVPLTASQEALEHGHG